MRKNDKTSMKITVGLGSIDDYPDFVRAGADEIFCGYIPDCWMKREGFDNPMNRREVRYVNVQAGSWSEMEILADMRAALGVPVTITMNSPYYDPDGYPVIMATMIRCADIGFDSFITADPGLIDYLNRNLSPADRKKLHFHLSGETGEINRYVIADARKAGISRIIFQRKCSLSDMATMIRTMREGRTCEMAVRSDSYVLPGKEKENRKSAPMEYEAFLLNEMCEFSGCYCNTLHCDEFAPACRIPYRMESGKTIPDDFPDPDEDAVGAGGCGLCALWEMRDIGINVLKIVSRGNYTENTIRDIRAVKRVLEILEDAPDEAEYIRRMKQELFPGGCGGACYYRQRKKNK